MRWATLLAFTVACGAIAAGPEPTPPASSTRADRGIHAKWPKATEKAPSSLRTKTRPTPHDLAQYRWLSGVRISADGSRIAYVVRSPKFDPKAKPSPKDTKAGWKVRSQLYVVDRVGGKPVQLTFGGGAVRSPRWSPDGLELAFLRSKGDKTALHVLYMRGGEARVIRLGKYEPLSFEWAPDSKSIAFTAVQPRTDAQGKQRWQSGGAIDWNTKWRQTHLFIVPRKGGKPRHVNQGTESIVQFHWSPDGKRFALVTAKSSDPYYTFSLVRPRVIRVSDGGIVKDFETAPKSIGHLEWSPNGRYVAYEVAEKALSHMNTLRVQEVDGSGSWNASAKLDPSLSGFTWSGDSRSIVAHVLERTKSVFYRLPVKGSGATKLPISGRVFGGLQADRNHRFVVGSSSTSNEPWAPTVIDLATNKVRTVASINPQVKDWELGPTEVVRWNNSEGIEIEGLLTVTPHAVAGTPPPLMVLPHGGPDSVTSESFSSWVHYFAARGYSVLRPNYRGGFGYGQAFYVANRGRLGEVELIDIESGVDHLIAAGKADPKRLFYGGWSWGGYISAWTLSHTSRYRAFVVGAGVIDVVTQYVTSDINHGVAAEWEFTGRPWSQPEVYDRSNPARRLAKATSPTLIIHGRNDVRVPFVNGQILYRALSDVGTEVELLAYPREPHGFREPAHIQHAMGAWAAWYDAHLPE